MTRTPKPDRGTERAAQLMTALGAQSAPIWAHLSKEDSERLGAAMDRLDGDGIPAAFDAGSALQDIEGQSAHLPTSTRQDRGIWDRLKTIPATKLAALLRSEPPQILAQLMVHMGPDKAAGVIRALPPEVSLETLSCILSLGPARAEAIAAIESELSEAFETLEANAEMGGDAKVARIFDALDPRIEDAFLSAIDHANPGAADRIRALMFGYDNLADLPPAGMQTLLASADRNLLLRALKGETGPVLKTVLANLTRRASELLTEEIETLGPLRRSEIDTARKQLTDLARDLIDSGDILPQHALDDDELVE